MHEPTFKPRKESYRGAKIRQKIIGRRNEFHFVYNLTKKYLYSKRR